MDAAGAGHLREHEIEKFIDGEKDSLETHNTAI
jgi:hypothetical protein